MKETPLTILALERDFIEALEADKDEILKASEPFDALMQYVDDSVPVYFYQLLEVAASNTSLATEEPEFYAFGGEHSPINAIAANVYQRLLEVGNKWLEDQDEETRTD